MASSYKITATLVLICLSWNQAFSDDREIVDKLVSAYQKDKPYLGLVVGITRPSGHQFLGYGQVSLQGTTKQPAADTLFEIGSVTKAFTGVVLADQVLAGTVSLNDPLKTFLPASMNLPRYKDFDITLLHLATHSSSLPVQPPDIAHFAFTTKVPDNPYAEYDLHRLSQSMKNIKLVRPIGSGFEYSNLGVGLLGHALANAAKSESYEALLAERLTEPLGLTDTCITLSAEQQERLAAGHTETGKSASPWTFASLESCGGLRSTARDLLVFIDAALERRKSSLTTAFRMAHESRRETAGPGASIGLCWFRMELPQFNRTIVWHNGGTGGHRSFLALVKETGMGIVILSNSAGSVDTLGFELLRELDEAS